MTAHRELAGRSSAIVIGASMAGLAMAQALTESFERVTVIDRDRIPDDIRHRNGVPQGRHLHVLLAAGADALEELFPGLQHELVQAGAPAFDLGTRGRTVLNGYRLVAAPMGRDDILASRPFIEGHVRQRLRSQPRVEIVAGCEVRGLLTSHDNHRVTGVEVASRTDVGGAQPRALHADLVVDCGGRRSALPSWLGRLGYAPPPVDELRVELHYATRHYRVPEAALKGDVFILVGPTAELPRGGGMTRTERDEWIVTLFGMGGDKPPLDPEGFEAFAGSLAADDLGEVMRRGEPLDGPVGFRYPANLRHRYDRLRSFPQGLLVAGDALCSFNPIYGQGMSVAAMEAAALRRLLRDGGVPSARAWFRSVAPIVAAPWELAIGGDLAVNAIEGTRSLPTRMVNRYMDRFYRAAVVDPVLSTRIGLVSGLLEPATLLLRPSTVARVIRGNLRAAALPADGRTRQPAAVR